MKYVYRCLFFQSLVWSLSFSAAAESLDSLQTEHTRLAEVRDSLFTQRAILAARLDTLANQIYRLKRADTGGVAETLQQALRQTLELADRIERVDMPLKWCGLHCPTCGKNCERTMIERSAQPLQRWRKSRMPIGLAG